MSLLMNQLSMLVLHVALKKSVDSISICSHEIMCTVLLQTSCSWNWLQGSRSHCNFGSNRQPADRDQHSENKFNSDVIQTHRKTLQAGFRQKLPLFWNPKNRDNPSDLIEKGSVSSNSFNSNFVFRTQFQKLTLSAGKQRKVHVWPLSHARRGPGHDCI